MKPASEIIERSSTHRRVLRFLASATAGVDPARLTPIEADALRDLDALGLARLQGSLVVVSDAPVVPDLIELALSIDSKSTDDELRRLREEHRQISDLLLLIQDLTSDVLSTDSIEALFPRAFEQLHRCVPFDVGAAVMVEQNLDLYLAMRPAAKSLVSAGLTNRIHETLEGLITQSFSSTEFFVRSEIDTLPGAVESENLDQEVHVILMQQTRPSGLISLYRSDRPFSADEHRILQIFSVQLAMLLGHLSDRDRILNLADTDDLTGIWNKRYFKRSLPQEIERARVYTLPLSLLFLDADNFKQVNDNFGHTVGDVFLSELCGTVRDTLRPPDLFARFGGDEFAIILPHTDLTGACSVAERILKRVRELTIPTDGDAMIQCSISIGVASCQKGDDMSALIRRADEALYVAKHAGRNRYEVSAT